MRSASAANEGSSRGRGRLELNTVPPRFDRHPITSCVLQDVPDDEPEPLLDPDDLEPPDPVARSLLLVQVVCVSYLSHSHACCYKRFLRLYLQNISAHYVASCGALSP